MIRPPDIHVGGLIFYQGFFLSFFLSFFRRLISEHTERHSTATCSQVSVIWKRMSNIWGTGIPAPTNRGPKNHLFRRLRNSTANLMAYILGRKHGIHKRASALQTARGLLHRLETTWTLVHKRLQIGSGFSPTLRKFCIPFHCQASQTEISKRKSTKLCQTVDDRPR